MSETNTLLNIRDHSRDVASLRYVYPVVSRRAGGVSLGINLNPNNACNWHCIYCQVPGLQRGGPPPLELDRLEQEFRSFLDDLLYGRFMEERVPPEMRRLVDVAFSGNGEPTSSNEFQQAVACIVAILQERGLALPVRVITNGSLMHRGGVQAGVKNLAAHGGEVWFKVDAVATERVAIINGVRLHPEGIVRRLRLCSEICPTWVQTCVFALDGQAPSPEDWARYRRLLSDAMVEGLRGVMLYGLARPSLQEGADRLAPLPAEEMERIASELGDFCKTKGLAVRLSP